MTKFQLMDSLFNGKRIDFNPHKGAYWLSFSGTVHSVEREGSSGHNWNVAVYDWDKGQSRTIFVRTID